MNDGFRICISSPPDREKLVAEIFFGDEQWAEVNQEQDNLMVEFYPKPSGQPWLLPFDSVLAALKEARNRLTARAGD